MALLDVFIIHLLLVLCTAKRNLSTDDCPVMVM